MGVMDASTSEAVAAPVVDAVDIDAVRMITGERVPEVASRDVASNAVRLTAVVDACQGCGACLLTCPEHAFRPRGGELHVLADRCTGCGECVEVCPVDAIELVPYGEAVGRDER